VSAKKEEEGYPELAFAFHVGMIKEVALTESDPTARVSLRFGPKAGIVTGTITDAATGNLLYPCAELKWKAKPEIFVSGTGLVSDEYRVLIPRFFTLFRSLLFCTILAGCSREPSLSIGNQNRAKEDSVRFGVTAVLLNACWWTDRRSESHT
jgi:hypothetical protein